MCVCVMFIFFNCLLQCFKLSLEKSLKSFFKHFLLKSLTIFFHPFQVLIDVVVFFFSFSKQSSSFSGFCKLLY